MNRLFTVAALSAGMLVATTAAAWYGGAWSRPYGSGAVTYERQNMMRGHRYAMQGLSDMLDGRRAFNRDEAVYLARELEAGFGDELIRNYAPGTWVAGSRTQPWTWDNFGVFSGYAEAARQAAGHLAAALEEEPSGEDLRQEGAWVPDARMLRGPRRLQHEGLISMDAVKAYAQLNATCHTCHMSFRGPRW